jgi:hypothetical protein
MAKLAELAVAGLASAAGAYLFGQFTKPPTPPPPPAPIAQIEPAQAELVRAVQAENAALIEELRKAESAKEAASEATAPRLATAAAPKPVKASPPPGASHKLTADRAGMAADRRGDRAYDAEIKPPAAPVDERTPAAAAPLDLGPAYNPAPQTVDSTAAIDQSPAREPDFIWFARLRRIRDIFRPAPSAPAPSGSGLAPRPPLPVGEFAQGAM